MSRHERKLEKEKGRDGEREREREGERGGRKSEFKLIWEELTLSVGKYLQ